MKIVVSFKVVPDDQDIQVSGDGSLDYAKAHQIVSTYDLNAMEAAAQLAAANEGSEVVGITVGGKKIDDSKTKKNVLARGVNELHMVADDACLNMDSAQTSEVLAAMLADLSWDVVICGDGSADEYAQQVDVQLAARLGVPSVNAVTSIAVEGDALIVERTLEDAIEEVRVPLPSVVAVTPDIAEPRIPGMKVILAAGKKPMGVSLSPIAPKAAIEVVSCSAFEAKERTCEVLDASESGAIEQFAAALKAAL